MLFHGLYTAHRVVTAAELAAEGVSASRRHRLAEGGLLRPAARGVYCFGPQLTGADRWRQRCAAALAAAGPDAALCRRAAAAVLGLDGCEPGAPVELNVPPGAGRRGPGLHRVASLEAEWVVDGLRVTGPGQTLLELGADLPAAAGRDLVELALEAALRRGLVELEALLALLVFTWRQVHQQPELVVAQTRAVLARAA